VLQRDPHRDGVAVVRRHRPRALVEQAHERTSGLSLDPTELFLERVGWASVALDSEVIRLDSSVANRDQVTPAVTDRNAAQLAAIVSKSRQIEPRNDMVSARDRHGIVHRKRRNPSIGSGTPQFSDCVFSREIG
jgi:hypothetical protein